MQDSLSVIFLISLYDAMVLVSNLTKLLGCYNNNDTILIRSKAINVYHKVT